MPLAKGEQVKGQNEGDEKKREHGRTGTVFE
jgi:hypothetical protein